LSAPTVKLANQKPFSQGQPKISKNTQTTYLIIKLSGRRNSRLAIMVGYWRQRDVPGNRHLLGRHGERGAKNSLGKACGQDAAEEDLREHVSLNGRVYRCREAGERRLTSVAVTFPRAQGEKAMGRKESERETQHPRAQQHYLYTNNLRCTILALPETRRGSTGAPTSCAHRTVIPSQHQAFWPLTPRPPLCQVPALKEPEWRCT
jgi:hypothetical protein